MFRVKYTTTDTGTGSLAVTAATGFDDAQASYIQIPGSFFPYALVSEDQTEWEAGYGSFYTPGTFDRNHCVDSSDGAGTKIDLPAGTHTILVPDGGLSNRIAQVMFTTGAQSIAAGSWISASFTGAVGSINAPFSLPGVSAPSFPTPTPIITVPYARAASAHVLIKAASTQTGFVMGKLTDGSNNMGGCLLNTGIDSGAMASLRTPLMTAAPVLAGKVSAIGSTAFLEMKLYNSGASAIDITTTMIVEYYL